MTRTRGQLRPLVRTTHLGSWRLCPPGPLHPCVRHTRVPRCRGDLLNYVTPAPCAQSPSLSPSLSRHPEERRRRGMGCHVPSDLRLCSPSRPPSLLPRSSCLPVSPPAFSLFPNLSTLHLSSPDSLSPQHPISLVPSYLSGPLISVTPHLPGPPHLTAPQAPRTFPAPLKGLISLHTSHRHLEFSSLFV